MLLWLLQGIFLFNIEINSFILVNVSTCWLLNGCDMFFLYFGHIRLWLSWLACSWCLIWSFIGHESWVIGVQFANFWAIGIKHERYKKNSLTNADQQEARKHWQKICIQHNYSKSTLLSLTIQENIILFKQEEHIKILLLARPLFRPSSISIYQKPITSHDTVPFKIQFQTIFFTTMWTENLRKAKVCKLYSFTNIVQRKKSVRKEGKEETKF